MGTTVDVIPVLPGETPERAIARVYEGGVSIDVDTDVGEAWMETIDNDVEAAPDGAFDGWRAEVQRRLFELFPGWSMEDDDGNRCLWTAGYRWQIEFCTDSITLRSRRVVNPDEPGPDDESLLAVFAGLRTILHWPDDYGTYVDLDDPDQRLTEI